MDSQPLINTAEFFSEGSLKRRLFAALFQKPLEKILGITTLNQLYLEANQIAQEGNHPTDYLPLLKALNVRYKITHGELEKIPTSGPVLTVSNHPFGGIDGIVLGDLLSNHRDDSKLMGNFILKKIPLIASHIIAVDPFGNPSSARYNQQGLRDSLKTLREGGCLGSFPAGKVAHFTAQTGKVADPTWHSSLARLAQKTKATVVPIHFEGKNSLLFQILGTLHPKIRTALLIRELINKQGKTISLRIGKLIQPATCQEYDTPEQLSQYFRLRSDVLAQKKPKSTEPIPSPEKPEHSPIAEPCETSLLLDELSALPPEALLCKKGAYHVYEAEAHQIPNLLHEIGRTRELTFRPIGEGTGKSLDLDVYDQHYHHLFLWNDETCELVGAYRIGKVDQILQAHGHAGLYSNSVFEYSDDAFDSLPSTLELGRSYIIPKYQRKGTSLFLLWRGILRFVAANPEYHRLFGVASISDDYHPLSKALILRYLRNHKMAAGFEEKIKARKKPQFENKRTLKNFDYPGAFPRLDNVSSLIEEIEPDEKGIPTLIKHYLQLNGVILGFGVDQGFNDALEGFILVDVKEMPRKLLVKYSGLSEAELQPVLSHSDH